MTVAANFDDETWCKGKPLPAVTPESEAFWTGGRDQKLMIARCGDCGRLHHPPLPICPHCQSWSVAPVPVSGEGVVVSYTINHQAWLPNMQVPFAIAYVSLCEQSDVWLLSNIVDCRPDQVQIGMRVRCRFVQHEDVWLPVFFPAGDDT